MEESLIALLLAHQPLTGLTGSRIYWVRAPHGVAKPYVVLQVIAAEPDMTHQGPSGLTAARVQADCYALGYGSGRAVARAVTGRLAGFRGQQGVTAFGGIFKDAERDGFEDADSTEKLFRVSMDFIIWHKGA